MSELEPFLKSLQFLIPASGVVHIGAGLPSSNIWYKSFRSASIDWIESDEHRHRLLSKRVESEACGRHWKSHQALLGPTRSQVNYHILSSPLESGLIEAAALLAVWPNLTASGMLTLQQTTFDDFASNNLAHHGQINWLYIDCLPALRIVQGANRQLQHADVIVARTIVSPLPVAHPLNGQGATLDELSAHLQTRSYRLLTTFEERNPAFATAVYVRDYVKLLQTIREEMLAQFLQDQVASANLVQKLEQQTQAAKALQAELTSVTLARDVEYNAKAELQAQLQQTQAISADLLQKLELQTQAVKALRAELESAIQARDAESIVKAELQTLLQQTQTARNELLQQHEHLSQSNQALEAKLIQEAEAAQRLEHRLHQFQAEHLETNHRQQLMDEELFKAEAQIELIKDLLLREPVEPPATPQTIAP